MTESPTFSLPAKSPVTVTVISLVTIASLGQASWHLAQAVCRQVWPLISAVVGLHSQKRRATEGR